MGEGQAEWMNYVFLGGMAVVFYFFIIRPQQKRQKEAKQLREGLKKGDQIVSAGGIMGKVVEVNDDNVVVDVDRGTKLTFEKSSISSVVAKND
ncbi:preprotein translocase subunit YajC [Cyclobacteriaceae bacterium]|nr:preprotein translocase subunit YajC [Cyclobacteriaceae bacterium]